MQIQKIFKNYKLRAASNELEHLVTNAAVVSFDFFDTLFVRPLSDPEDAFEILARQLSMPDFRHRRREAQAEAFRRMLATGRREITLHDIYSCFDTVGANSAELICAERALELALVQPNPEMFDLFAKLIKDGKPVVITSDMYFSADFFAEVLRPFGLAHVQVFCSADCNATKRDRGELFDIVVDHFKIHPEKILHIGDSLLADVTRARERGLKAYHYSPSHRRDSKVQSCLATSIGYGLLGTHGKEIPPNSFTEIGYLYGGAANLGFFEWVQQRAIADDICHVLFLARDGYSLERIAKTRKSSGFRSFSYFLGSRTAYTMAAINSENFTNFLPFFLSGSDGLAPAELLERVGVQSPSLQIMLDLELGPEVRINAALHNRLSEFLYAYRWKILEVCQNNRRALFQYLRQIGVKAGSKIALVDVGWNGTTQEAFELAVKPLMPLEVVGYYFCLADTPERFRRDQEQRMSAMVSAASTSTATVATIYANRVAVEQFFSAPHDSVVGLQVGSHGIEPVMDAGRGDTKKLRQIATEVCAGIELFATHYAAIQQRLNIQATPLQIAWPLIEMLTDSQSSAYQLLGGIKNFDAWGSSVNHELVLKNYLVSS